MLKSHIFMVNRVKSHGLESRTAVVEWTRGVKHGREI